MFQQEKPEKPSQATSTAGLQRWEAVTQGDDGALCADFRSSWGSRSAKREEGWKSMVGFGVTRRPTRV